MERPVDCLIEKVACFGKERRKPHQGREKRKYSRGKFIQEKRVDILNTGSKR